MVRQFCIFVFCLIFANIGFSAAVIDGNPDALAKLSQQFENFQKQLNSMEDLLKSLQISINQKVSSDDSGCMVRDITEAVKTHKFQQAEEKLGQLVDKNKISNIVHDVYAGSAVNADIILAFAKVLSDSDLQLRVFGALRDEMRSSGYTDPFKLIALVDALERAVLRQRNASPEMKAMSQSVIDGAVEDVKVVATGILKAAMVADKYQKNVEIETLASAIFNFRAEVSDEVIEGLVDSVFGVVAAGKILNNIGSHNDIPQVITGLTAVFNRFNFAGNLNNDATLDLASHLRKLQLRDNYLAISQALKDDVDRIVQKLPICAKNLFFHTYVCLWNKGRGEYLYAADSSISFDAERRSIYTWYPGDIKTGAYWYAERYGDDFYFKNRDHADEYMYAVLKDYNKDSRYVFNWIPGNNTDGQSAWGIELDGDYCYIKSKYVNEYLFASAVRYDQLNSYVFTWKPGTSVRSAEFQWQIRNCGQSDSRPMLTG